MGFNRLCILFLGILTVIMIFNASAIFASDNGNLKEYDFDSYFRMDVPNDVNFEKTEGNGTDNITFSVNYKDDDKKINVVYSQTKNNGKEDLVNYYSDMAKNDPFVNISTENNITVLHFGDENTIGDIEYHDMAIAGNASQYILIQCDDQDLMNSMVSSIKFD